MLFFYGICAYVNQKQLPLLALTCLCLFYQQQVTNPCTSTPIHKVQTRKDINLELISRLRKNEHFEHHIVPQLHKFFLNHKEEELNKVYGSLFFFKMLMYVF